MSEPIFNRGITRNKTNRFNRFRVGLYYLSVLLFCQTLFISCQNAAQHEASLYSQDANAKSEIMRLNQLLTTGQSVTAADFESIKQIRVKYPNTAEVRVVYQSALINRSDWESVAELIEAIPASQRTRDDNLNLAKTYLKLARYQEEIALVKPLAEKDKKDFEFNSLLAFGHFFLGQDDEAARLLDSFWETIIQNRRLDEINTRGMIYFRQKNYAKATEIFEKSLEINTNNTTAYNYLSRIYAAQGNEEKAEFYRAKTVELNDKSAADSLEASRRVQQIYALETAWKAKNYSEVINLAKQILPTAVEKDQKIVLYQYLFESYKALGNEKEANDALTEAQKLQQQK